MSDLKARCDLYPTDLIACPFPFEDGPGRDDEWCVYTPGNANSRSYGLTGNEMNKADAILFADLVNHFRRQSP